MSLKNKNFSLLASGREERRMRECNECEITVEKLIRLVHSYTDPIKIRVVMGDEWLTCDEARHMSDFYLTSAYTWRNKEETERLLKYYKDVPVWNLCVWVDGTYSSDKGRALYMGIEAHCYYKDIREGWIAERQILNGKSKENIEKEKWQRGKNND